jgi:hypothetical protein
VVVEKEEEVAVGGNRVIRANVNVEAPHRNCSSSPQVILPHPLCL